MVRFLRFLFFYWLLRYLYCGVLCEDRTRRTLCHLRKSMSEILLLAHHSRLAMVIIPHNRHKVAPPRIQRTQWSFRSIPFCQPLRSMEVIPQPFYSSHQLYRSKWATLHHSIFIFAPNLPYFRTCYNLLSLNSLVFPYWYLSWNHLFSWNFIKNRFLDAI